MRKIVLFFIVLSFLGGGALLSSGLMVPAKAWLSVHMIDMAWHLTKQGHKEVKPWPWMDSYPVAKLNIPALEKKHIILKGVSGEVLAFSPGWHDGTDPLGAKGVSVISAHKDTHFSYLKKLRLGQKIEIETKEGLVHSYRIVKTQIVQTPEIQVSGYEQSNVLILTTCFPFSNWQIGGKMRYVVVAKQEDIALASL